MQKDKLKAISLHLVWDVSIQLCIGTTLKGPVTLEELSQIVYDIFMKGVGCYKGELRKNLT